MIAPPPENNSAIESRRVPLATVRICNSLWGASGLNYEKQFQTTMQHDFGAELHQVDFATDPEAARSQINTWASDATNKKIPQAVPRGMVNRGTRVVLVNAVYFKANWLNDFRDSATLNQPFHVDDVTSANVPLMHRQIHVSYSENDQLQAAELPYQGDFSMVILLPKKTDGLKEMESTFSADSFGKLLDSASTQLLDVHLPRFKMDCHYELSKPLGELGMKQAFTPAADFSGISATEHLMIDAVSHSTFIAVDEKGTEAAAVTAMGMTATAMRARPEEPIAFRADHPFLFVIRSRSSGAILFLGRVSDPR
jgi:serpin B